MIVRSVVRPEFDVLARPEPFDSPLILSRSPLDMARGDPEALEGSKDEQFAQDRPVDQPPRFALRRSAVALAKAEGRAVCSWFDKLTTSVEVQAFRMPHRIQVEPGRRVQIKMLPVPDRPERLARAYAACEALARSHYENFPVASRLLPPPMRPHVAAVYAFARVADDIADEGTAPPAERLTQLDAWRRRLHAAVAVERSADAPTDHEDLIVVALAHSIRSLDLPIALFDDLLSAFAQDTMTTRYGSWDEVLDYCRRSANPIGRLVLRIAGYRDDGLDRSSDALCTALQLTNFWQDVGRDWRAGRLYVPRDVAAACGALEAELNGRSLTASWMAALDRCVAETRRHFDAGREVCDGVRGRLRFELRFTWLGGARMLDHVQHAGAALLTNRPRLGARDLPVMLWRAARWRSQDR